MSIDVSTIRHVAALARLTVTDEEQRAEELSSILSYVARIAESDVNSDPVLSAPMQRRPDTPVPSMPDLVLGAAPSMADRHITVPTVVSTD